MAISTRRLVIDPNASIPISIADPLSSLKDDYNQGRIRITPGAVDFPTLEEQRQGLIGGSGSNISVRPSISGVPNVAPFPLGCPVGFYQQGDVCIPSVDLTDPITRQVRHGGKAFPKGILLDVIPPELTFRDEFFYVQALIENDGSVEGKFFLTVDIPSLNVTATTNRVVIPAFRKALLYKRIRMPFDAPSLEDIPAEVSVAHLNEEEQHATDEPRIVDDVFDINIPGPLAGPPEEEEEEPEPEPEPEEEEEEEEEEPEPEPEPLEECYEIDGKEYCRTNNPDKIDCYIIAGERYCTEEELPIPEPPEEEEEEPPFEPPEEEEEEEEPLTCPPGRRWSHSRQRCVLISSHDHEDEEEAEAEAGGAQANAGGDGATATAGGGTATAGGGSATAGRGGTTAKAGGGKATACAGGKCITAGSARAFQASLGNCFTSTLARLYGLSKRYQQTIRFVDIRSLAQEFVTNRYDMHNTAVRFCQVPSPSQLAVQVGGAYYEPSDTMDENEMRTAAITTNPIGSVKDGESVQVTGINFSPGEAVHIEMRQTLSAIDPTDSPRIRQFEGRVFPRSTVARADRQGSFATMMRTYEMPAGLEANVLFRAIGARSQKISQHSITVV